MNEEIISSIAQEQLITTDQVKKTLSLLEEGNTIPFIARYRKEFTGGLYEDKIKSISLVYEYECNLLKRKEDVIRLIDEKGLLTDELKDNIMKCKKLVDVEDIYRPYKEKKKTKATDAINNGLEPLAKIILSFPDTLYVDKFINDKVKTEEDAIQGAKYIIAEYISDNAYYRKYIRDNTFNHGTIVSKLKKNAEDPKKIYEMYYDFEEEVKKIKPHRVLALNRGENENVLSVSVKSSKEFIIKFLESKMIKKENKCAEYVRDAINDSYTRLIEPSIEREIRSELSEVASDEAIENFGKNLECLLMQPPIKNQRVLGFDPGYSNGCKLAVLDETGKYLYSTVIKPFASSEKEALNAKNTVLKLIKEYKIDIVSIGNGTASRESEKMIADLIKEYNLDCKYIIVNEAGASIYSTEEVAQEEFPDLTPNERSAVSIGRRLQDPLAELVKIPPDGIGVGLYQHDVPDSKLKDRLDFVVEKTVNQVGVNINTASSSILKHISGLTKRSIDKLIKYREDKGKIKSREEISKLLTDKTYLGLTLEDIGTDKLITKLESINKEELVKELNTDIYTLEGIIESLEKPNRDPRDELPRPILKSDVLSIDDLEVGMELEGTVRNVAPFGAFIDIGLHNDGLVHISEISDSYIKHPSDVLSVGDIVKVYVKEIFKDKEKVSLTMKGE